MRLETRTLYSFGAPSRISGLGAHGAPASRGPQRAVFARWGGRSGAGQGAPGSDEPGFGAEPRLINTKLCVLAASAFDRPLRPSRPLRSTRSTCPRPTTPDRAARRDVAAS